MTQASNLHRLFRGLEALYGSESGINPHDHLLPYQRADDDQSRELVVFREAEDGALEVGLALDQGVLQRFQAGQARPSPASAGLGEFLAVLEGLSHLLYLAESARCERPVSGLELETQAEVDKLAVLVLHHWPIPREQFDTLVDRLYYRFSLSPAMDAGLQQRYQTANRVALAFSRRLRPHVDRGRIAELRQTLRAFWSGSMNQKRRLAS